MWRVLVALALAPAAASAAASPSSPATKAVEFWVDCERGSDAAAGTSATSAFATLRKARDAVRAAGRAPASPGALAAVNLVGGRTCRSWLQQDDGGAGRSQGGSLRLDHRDSHVAWRAVGPPSVLSGGIPVNASDWKPLTPAQRGLFRPAATKSVVALDLTGVVADIGRLKGLSYSGGDACIATEFFEESGLELVHAPPATASGSAAAGRKLVMARFPDLVEPPVLENWASVRDPNNTVLAITIDASAEQQAAWAQQIERGEQLFSHGLWSFNWADSHRRVLSATPAGVTGGVRLALQQHGDYTDRDCALTAAAAGTQGGHVYLYNVHYELDTPGEYSIDHVTKTLYFWPPADLGGSFELSVATSLLTVTGAEGISFAGLDLRGARGVGVVIVNSSGIILANATLSDTGMNTVNITGGHACGVSNMTLLRGGTGGVVLDGGDRQTLSPSSHFVRGSTVRDCNRWIMNYAPLVLMAGVGQSVRDSVLADAPQMAVFVQGNLHHLLNSQIRDVVQQCNDCGSFYFGRDWTYRGMRISGCNFSLPGPMWDMSWGANGIYADDFSSSVDVVGNTFNLGAKMRMVFFSNGGRDHSFVDNVVRPLAPNTAHGVTPVARLNSNCHGPCTDCIYSQPYRSFLQRVPYNTSAIWEKTFPRLASMMWHKPCEGAGNTIVNNTVCFAGGGASLVDDAAIAKFDSAGGNNKWDDVICGGSAPPPPPPPAAGGCQSGASSLLPVLQLAQPAHGESCGVSYKTSSSWHRNATNGAIFAVNGQHQGRVLAIDCCMDATHCGAQAHEEPVVIASVDAPEFKTLKNVVFDSFPTVAGGATEIKLTKSEKCLVANGTVVSLDACAGAGTAAEWTVEAGEDTAFVLVSRSSGACVV
jgi:hypothetical protein